MPGDAPPESVRRVDEQRVPEEPGGALRERKIDDAPVAAKRPSKPRDGGDAEPHVLDVPGADVPPRAVVARVEMLDVEVLTKNRVPEHERGRDRDAVNRRWHGPDDDQP